MPAYPDAANPDLLGLIPLTARTVLDVGCGTGALGMAYRRLNPRARLLGIEVDSDAASIAAERLDDVATVDVETDPLPFDASDLDCVVYGDVLEHLREPWPVISHHAAALGRDGTLLICVPNVEHWSFIERLLRGTWDYDAAGLFDRTHLRWFSLDSMRRGLLAAGLVPYDVRPRIFNTERPQALHAALLPALRSLGIDDADFLRRTAPLQFVWRVRRAAPRVVALGASMLAPVGGVSHVRVMHPLQAMATVPGVIAQIATPADLSPIGAETPRIYILHRPVLTGEPGLAVIRRLLQSGWLIVTEFDDHPDYFLSQSGADQHAFSGVHAVQTSSPVLADILRVRNPEVKVFPNAIHVLPDIDNFADLPAMTLFFGALNRKQDWEPLMPTLNHVASMAGDRLRFCVVHDEAFFDALETPHKTFTPVCDYDTYLGLLGQCEISLMPLQDNAFNRAKSDLKFIEAGACGTVALASHIVYSRSIRHGQTGLLFGDADDLRAQLLRLLAMPDLAITIANAARAYVAEERMLAYQVAKRLAWYNDLWSRRAELTAELHRRLAARAPVPSTPGPE
jgi:SAM-dependent methyltransferase